jgi:curved DNA-binding protein CbpA
MGSVNHYETLGVQRDASIDQLRRAYLARTAQLRPERLVDAPPNVLTALAQASALVDKAWRILGDPLLRAAYDEELDQRTDAQETRAERVWAMERELGWSLSPVYGLEPPTVLPDPSTDGRRAPGGGTGADQTGLAGPVSVPSEQGDVVPAITLLEVLANWLAPRRRVAKTVMVPDVRGLRASEAFYAVARADLEINFVRLSENPSGGGGTVVAQDPGPGVAVRRHSRLTVHVVHPSPAAGITLG